jgi:hypothetical protein
MRHRATEKPLVRNWGTVGGLGERHGEYPKPPTFLDEAHTAVAEIQGVSVVARSEWISMLLRGSEEDLHCGHDFD